MIDSGSGNDFTEFLPAFAEEFPNAGPPYVFLNENRDGQLHSAYPIAPALMLAPAYAPAVWHKQAKENPSPAEWLAWARKVEPFSAAFDARANLGNHTGAEDRDDRLVDALPVDDRLLEVHD